MKNRIIIIMLSTIFSLGITSVSFANDAMPNKNQSCKKQAKTMKFKNKKEKVIFMKACKQDKVKKEAQK